MHPGLAPARPRRLNEAPLQRPGARLVDAVQLNLADAETRRRARLLPSKPTRSRACSVHSCSVLAAVPFTALLFRSSPALLRSQEESPALPPSRACAPTPRRTPRGPAPAPGAESPRAPRLGSLIRPAAALRRSIRTTTRRRPPRQRPHHDRLGADRAAIAHGDHVLQG